MASLSCFPANKPERLAGEVDQISCLAKQAELIKIIFEGKPSQSFVVCFRES
jgi:hypothetical protein